MTERKPTKDQRVLLGLLRERPLKTRQIAKLRGHWATYDSTHAALARLEKRGMVTGIRRSGEGGALWDLTNEGRAHADG